MLNVNFETRINIAEEVSELLVPGTHFDRQPYSHHMVTGQTTQTNQFFTGRILALRHPPSQQHRNLSTQVSQDNNLPMVEQTPRYQKSDANHFIDGLNDAMAGIATQQRAATMLKTVSTNRKVSDGKDKQFELFGELFHTRLKMQLEMTDAVKINHFYTHSRKEALQTFKNKSAQNGKVLYDVLVVLRRYYVEPESQATAKPKLHKLTIDLNSKSLSEFLEELNECA